MRAITCSKCGKPIVGYYGVLNEFKKAEKIFCINCAQATTVWDLMVTNDVETMPDIISEDDLPPCVPENEAYDAYADTGFIEKN